MASQPPRSVRRLSKAIESEELRAALAHFKPTNRSILSAVANALKAVAVRLDRKLPVDTTTASAFSFLSW
jgi:hypothetical protein